VEVEKSKKSIWIPKWPSFQDASFPKIFPKKKKLKHFLPTVDKFFGKNFSKRCVLKRRSFWYPYWFFRFFDLHHSDYHSLWRRGQRGQKIKKSKNQYRYQNDRLLKTHVFAKKFSSREEQIIFVWKQKVIYCSLFFTGNSLFFTSEENSFLFTARKNQYGYQNDRLFKTHLFKKIFAKKNQKISSFVRKFFNFFFRENFFKKLRLEKTVILVSILIFSIFWPPPFRLQLFMASFRVVVGEVKK
jgi:hypothetical protein